jgi:hypothetical protein
MLTQVMRSEFDTDQFAGFDHHHSGSLIGNREYPIAGCIAHLQRVFAQSIRYFLWDEHEFVFLAAFRLTKNQFPVLQVSQSQLQHFTDSHTTTGHQFKNQPISNLGGAEDDFVNGYSTLCISVQSDMLCKSMLE